MSIVYFYFIQKIVLVIDYKHFKPKRNRFKVHFAEEFDNLPKALRLYNTYTYIYYFLLKKLQYMYITISKFDDLDIKKEQKPDEGSYPAIEPK